MAEPGIRATLRSLFPKGIEGSNPSLGTMDYEKELLRQWEINVYNNLGFICNGYTVEETNRGWKNETRDATDIEASLWEKFADVTPEIPAVQISDDIDLWSCSMVDLPFKEEYDRQSCDGKAIWLENKYDKVLFGKSGYPLDWSPMYRHIKDFRPVTGN